VLDPSTGAVIWSSVALPRGITTPGRIALNPATGRVDAPPLTLPVDEPLEHAPYPWVV
jgi:hypothetical protein